jgi:hypothetical protein
MGDIFDKLARPADIFDRISGPGAEAASRLKARGIDPDRPVDDQMEKAHGCLAGLYDSIIPSREALSGILNAAGGQGPVEQAKALFGLGKNLVGAQLDQAGKAKDAYLRGDIIEGMGHSAAAGTPLIGPAAANAGEEIKEGNISYGLGKAAGLVATSLLPARAGGRVEKMTAGAADDIARAEQAYGSVFSKSKGQRNLVERSVPEMMDRGIVVNDPKVLAAKADDAAAAIDIEGMIRPGTTVQAQPILDRIRQAQTEEFHPVNGSLVPKTPEAESIVAALDDYADLIRQHSVNGAIDAHQALELRQRWEKGPGDRGLYADPNKAVSTSNAVHMEAAGAVRPEINAIPGIGPANAEKSFQLNLKKIAEAAPQAKTPGAVMKDFGTHLAAAGLAQALPGVGNVVGAGIAGWGSVKVLRELPKTPAWQTARAIHKRDFAKALQAGDYSTAAEIGAGIVSGELIADEFGHREAVREVRATVPANVSQRVAAQLIGSQTASYVQPDGIEVPVPPGVVSAFLAGNMEEMDSPINRWLRAMSDQKKIESGGRLRFSRQNQY